MSAFLGPVHTWLYGKIMFQNEIVDRIVQMAEEKGWMNENIRVERYGTLEEGELANIVDESDIHGWLQEKVSLVENKLAYIVTVLTEEDAKRIMNITEVVYEIGTEHTADENVTVAEAYSYLETILLNGMPCDRVNEKVTEDENYIIWQQVTDIHEGYWSVIKGNLEFYYLIRESLIAGILKNTKIDYEEKDNHMFELRKIL